MTGVQTCALPICPCLFRSNCAYSTRTLTENYLLSNHCSQLTNYTASKLLRARERGRERERAPHLSYGPVTPKRSCWRSQDSRCNSHYCSTPFLRHLNLPPFVCFICHPSNVFISSSSGRRIRDGSPYGHLPNWR